MQRERQPVRFQTLSKTFTALMFLKALFSDVTDKILPQIEEWQNRPLDDIYPVIYIDAIHYFSRRQRSDCQKAAYVILGLT